tara:strand:- start:19 stop:360 length:342 start_codon:yes stop_codon:yes gene_type:complete
MVVQAYNKLLKRTLNSWLASFLAILANNFAPLSKALCGKEASVGIEQLNGFQLEAVHFGTAFYNLVFDGEKDGKATTFHVGTNYYISKSIDHLEDLSENISVLLCNADQLSNL